MSVAISLANKMQLTKCDIMVGFPISSHIYIMLCSSTADVYTHSSNTYVLTCSLYPRPLSYYTNVHIPLVDVYMYMVYIHHHNTHHCLGVVVDCLGVVGGLPRSSRWTARQKWLNSEAQLPSQLVPS